MEKACKEQILTFLSLVLCLDSAKIARSLSFCSLSSLGQIKNSVHSNFSFLKALQEQGYYSLKCLGSGTNTQRHSLAFLMSKWFNKSRQLQLGDPVIHLAKVHAMLLPKASPPFPERPRCLLLTLKFFQ